MTAARKWRRSVLSVVALLLLTACWNRRELNELAITAALGLDKAGEGFRASIQVINPGELAAKKGGSLLAPVVLYVSEGRTVTEALRRLSTEMPRDIYLAHLRIVVIGEDLARTGIARALDVLSRYHEIRTDFSVVVARNRPASEILSTLTRLEKIPANNLSTALEISDKAWAATNQIKLDELISAIGSEGKGTVMTGIELDGDPEKGQNVAKLENTFPSTILRYSGLAVMSKDKLVGWLNETESKGYHYTKGKLTDADLVIPCPEGGYADIELVRMNAKVRGRMKAGNPVGTVDIHAEGNLKEAGCRMEVMTLAAVARMERDAESEIREAVQAAVRVTQDELRSDVIGFGEAVHRTSPAAWKRLKREWTETYSDMDINVNVDMKIRRMGTINEPVPNDVEE